MDAQNVTPMMQQYLSAKEAHPGELLFFRLGDFYEMFFDDAKIAAKELGLTLTSRSGDLDKNPMCGVPYHAADSYIARLVAKGFKVAIAEQIGDPKAKGLTHREVVKVVTPGTALSDEVLRDAANIYIALLHDCGDGKFVLAGADISTGEAFYASYAGETAAQQIMDELYRRMTAELLLTEGFSLSDTVRAFLMQRLPRCAVSMVAAEADGALLTQHFPVAEIPSDAGAQTAVETLLHYLHDTVRTDLSQINRLSFLDTRETMQLDTYTLRNLEITRSLRDGGKKNTLFDVLDFTRTPMGTRLLRAWLEHPLLTPHRIDARLDAVAELVENAGLRGTLREPLSHIDRADVCLMTKVDQAAPGAIQHIWETFRSYNQDGLIIESIHQPRQFVSLSDWYEDIAAGGVPVTEMEGKKVLAVSAIGNPASFEQTLADLGIEMVESMRYPDHHDYGERDMAEVLYRAETLGVEAIVITEKDAVKVPADVVRAKWRVPIYVISVEVTFQKGREEFFRRLEKQLAAKLRPVS